MEALSDAEYCLTPRDQRCIRRLLEEHEQTLDDMVLAADTLKNEEGDGDDQNKKSRPRVSFDDLVGAGLLKVGDLFKVIDTRKVGDKYKDAEFRATLVQSAGMALEIEGVLCRNPSTAAKAVGSAYPGWDLFQKEGSGNESLRSCYDRYLEIEKARVAKFPLAEKKYADSVLSSRKQVFLLIERAINFDGGDFALPAKYASTSVANFDYSILLDELEVNEGGSVPAYFKNKPKVKASVNLSKKPYVITMNDKPLTALEATKTAAKETDQETAKGTYQWSAYWFIEGTEKQKYKDKSFKQAYESVAKKT